MCSANTLEVPALETKQLARNSQSKLIAIYVSCVTFVHVGILAYGIFVHGPGWDEVGHLPSGLSHWHTGRFDLYRVNPPLVRTMATLPLVFHDVGIQWRWNPVYDASRAEWDLGKELIETHGRNYLDLLRIARLACIPFAILAIWGVWQWSRTLFGELSAALSVTVWAFSPLVLANAQMITPDTAAAAFGGLACFTFRNWLFNRTGVNAFLCGTALGLAELTKFTWLILFALWPIQWLMHRWIVRDHLSILTDIKHLLFLFSISIFVINIGFGFEGVGRPLGRYDFLSQSLGGSFSEEQNDWLPGNRFRETPLANIPVPLPVNMLQGIDRQKLDFESGFPSYLRGQWSDSGWWYYYLYGWIIKEPLGFIALPFLAITMIRRLEVSRINLAESLHLLLPGLALFVFVSSQTGFNHHLRYVLPSWIFIAIGVGFCAREGVIRQRTIVAPLILVSCGTLASLLSLPHSHSFFNLLVGGPPGGPKHLLNSNIDWGQDILLVEKWAKNNPDKPLDGVVHSLPVWLGVRHLTSLPTADVPGYLPDRFNADSQNLIGPQPGRYAISVIWLYRQDSPYAYFRKLEAEDQVGYTTFIYNMNLKQANALRQQLGLPPLPTGKDNA